MTPVRRPSLAPLLGPLSLLLIGALLPCLIALGFVAVGAGLLMLAAQIPLGVVFALPCLLVGLGWLLRLFHLFPGPAGRTLAAAEAPELLARLDEIQRGFSGPQVRRVFLERRYGLVLHMLPVLGVLGWSSPFWNLGAFSLMYLNERESTAALGWGVAYWSDQHGWCNLQAKRLVEFWYRMALVTEPMVDPAAARQRGVAAPTRLARVLKRCDQTLGPYARWFHRRATPFLHQQIAVADRSAASAYGAQTFGRALLKLALAEPLLETHLFHPWLAAAEGGEPGPAQPLQAALDFYRRPPPARAKAHLHAALRGLVPSAPPFLWPRLEALGVEPRVPLAPERSAFEALVPPSVAEALEAEWRNDLRDLWRQRAGQREREDRRYEMLRAAEASGELAETGLLELATLAESRERDAAYAERLDRLVAARPGNGNARLLFGRFHLERGDPERGRAALDQLAVLNPLNGALVLDLLAEHLERRGEAEEAARIRVAAIDLKPAILAARAERQAFRLRDPMLPHGLAEAERAELLAGLQGDPRIRQLYLVRKAVRHFPETPVFLLGVVPRGAWARSEKLRQELQGRVLRDVCWPAQSKGFVLVFGGRLAYPIGPLVRVRGSEVYHRGRRWLPAGLRRCLAGLGAHAPVRSSIVLGLLGVLCIGGLALSRPSFSSVPASLPPGQAWGSPREEPAATSGLPLATALEACDFAHALRAHDDFRSIVRGRLARKQFTDLDGCAEAFLRSRARLPGGEWKYFALFEALGEPNGGEDRPDAAWLAHLALLRNWLAANPTSESARVACAAAMLNYAWKAENGNNLLDELSGAFSRRIRAARQTLEVSPVQPPRSPMWYRIMQQVAAAQHWAPADYESLLARAVALEPTFAPLYAGKARYLHWILNGRGGDWEAFAREAADRLGGDDGDELYFLILQDQSLDIKLRELFADPGVSWPRMKRGFALIDQRYGGNIWFLNAYAFLASHACDREETRRVLERIGSRWDVEVWGANTSQARMLRWARGQ